MSKTIGAKMMSGKFLAWLLATVLLTTASLAAAQQPGKIYWIGYLAGAGSGPSPAFTQGLRDLGYVEGKNIAFVFRTAEGRGERYSDLAAELVRLKVDIIVADGTGPSTAAKKATGTIPIVMTTSGDPVGTGLIASFARPGGNVTGLTSVTGELGGKQLELLKETVPGLNRVAILMTTGLLSDLFVKEMEPSARALGVKLIPLVYRGPEDFEGAFRSATKERVNGLIVRPGPAASTVDLKWVAELTVKNRLPAISTSTFWADSGGLMSYGASQTDMYRRAATYVDKILKGTKPADLPVEAPMKFDLVINLRTAKQIGLTVSPDLLARATKIIR